MKKIKDNVIATKSYVFALNIISLYKELLLNKEYVISKQILRSGTSIGANVHEAIAGESKKDFIHKLSIAAKEALETSYWLQLLNDSKYISEMEFKQLDKSCQELIKIINSIILTTKQRYFSKIHHS